MIRCELFVVFIVLAVVLNGVNSQVCNKTISVLREVSETYQYTYYEAYEDQDCLIWCLKSKLSVNVGTREVEKLVTETVTVCCDGYIEDDSYKGDGLQCIPLCNPPCDNGFCRNPNECACAPGYTIYSDETRARCVPLCLEGCSTPDCIPTCSQYDDYDSSETDMCHSTCLNGTCVAPGVCHCDPGYRRLFEVCEPVCSSCNHGSCIAPGLCKCDPGWREEFGSCQPICSGCEHGTCKAPGQCECDPGYKAENAKCMPHCSICSNGNCIAPEVCTCDPGWYLIEDGWECMAHCDVACGNGSCVAPNLCQCFSGYRSNIGPDDGDDRYNESPRCVPECNYCDGLCVAPEVCRCEVQYETVYTTIDGSECDCFDCSDAGRKCERTTCRRKSNETNVEGAVVGVNEPELSAALPKHFEVPMSIANTTYIGIANSMNATTCTNWKSAGFTYHWMYAAIILFEMLVIICLLVIMEKKHLFNRLKAKKFAPQDKPRAEVAVHYTSSVTCSKMKETTEPGST